LRKHDFDKAQMLLAENPRLDLNDLPETDSGELMLHLAGNSQFVLLHLLTAGANPKSFCKDGRNAVQCLANSGTLSPEVAKLLGSQYKGEEEKKTYINSLDENGDRSAAHYAASSSQQNPSTVEALQEMGVDWTKKDKEGRTPFELAATYGHSLMTSSLAKWHVNKQHPQDLQSRQTSGPSDDPFEACHLRLVDGQDGQNVSRQSI
jgi:ankyrin repeat protein